MLPFLFNFCFLFFLSLFIFCSGFEIMTFFAVSPSLVSCSAEMVQLSWGGRVCSVELLSPTLEEWGWCCLVHPVLLRFPPSLLSPPSPLQCLPPVLSLVPFMTSGVAGWVSALVRLVLPVDSWLCTVHFVFPLLQFAVLSPVWRFLTSVADKQNKKVSVSGLNPEKIGYNYYF